MSRAKYQFETDFLTTVPTEHTDFVSQVYQSLVKENYKPKITVTKSTGLQLAFWQPKVKSTMGIIAILFMRADKLILRIYGFGYEEYLDLIETLPDSLVKQVDKAHDCKKFIDPTKCFKGCIGHKFQIRGKVFQKCYVDCFEFEVTTADALYLMQLIEAESKVKLKRNDDL